MRFHNASAYRQPHTHAGRFGGEQWFENAIADGFTDPGA
jgi:hypothetical protein